MAHPDRSKIKLWIVYGTAHFGKSLMWAASGIVFAFFLTEVVRIRPDVMGAIIGVSLMTQAALDLLVGRWLSKRVQSHRRAADAQLRGALLAAAGFVLFSCAGLIPSNLTIPYAFATLLLFRLGCSYFDVPQNAFMAFVTHSDAWRARYSAMRYVMSGVAALVMTLIITPVVRAADRDSAAVNFLHFSLMIAFISIVCSALLYVVARHQGYDGSEMTDENVKDRENEPVSGRLFKPVFIGVLLAIFALNMAGSVFSNLEAYFVAYGLRDTQAAAYFLVSVAVGQIAAQPLWAWLSTQANLERVFTLASLMFFVAGCLFLRFAHVGGAVTLLIAAMYGAAYGGAAMSVWSLLAKSTASAPSRTTQQYGLFTCCSKLAQMSAIVTVGIVLASFDYRDGAHGQFQLRVVMGIAPVIGGVLALTLVRSGLFRTKQTKAAV